LTQGIVHRDLTPDNIVIQDDCSVRLVNFDFSRIEGKLSVSPRKRAQPGAYTAPEQVLSASDVDARADLFALGVLWVELLTGHPLRESSQLRKIAGISEGPCSLIESLLAEDRGRRPASADEVLASMSKIAVW
jgi:serine/threonine protein kinase